MDAIISENGRKAYLMDDFLIAIRDDFHQRISLNEETSQEDAYRRLSRESISIDMNIVSITLLRSIFAGNRKIYGSGLENSKQQGEYVQVDLGGIIYYGKIRRFILLVMNHISSDTNAEHLLVEFSTWYSVDARNSVPDFLTATCWNPSEKRGFFHPVFVIERKVSLQPKFKGYTSEVTNKKAIVMLWHVWDKEQ